MCLSVPVYVHIARKSMQRYYKNLTYANFWAFFLQITPKKRQKSDKMHFFSIFFEKNLVNSKKSSNFAPAFGNEAEMHKSRAEIF